MFQIKKISLLNENNITGENKLTVLNKYGLNCELTDLAIITGCLNKDSLYNIEVPYQIINYTKSNLTAIDRKGVIKKIPHNDTSNATIRPILTISNEIPFYMNKGISETIYGSFPQTACDYYINKLLENLYQENSLETTGQNYYLPSLKNKDFKLYPEYQFQNEKYIRIISYQRNFLSNGKVYTIHEPFWIKVEPLIWLYDKSANTLISKYGIMAGINNYNEEEINKILNNLLIEIQEKNNTNFLSLENIIEELNNQNFDNLSLQELTKLKEKLTILNEITNIEKQITDEKIKQKTR